MIGHYVNAHPRNVSLASVGQKDTEEAYILQDLLLWKRLHEQKVSNAESIVESVFSSLVLPP